MRQRVVHLCLWGGIIWLLSGLANGSQVAAGILLALLVLASALTFVQKLRAWRNDRSIALICEDDERPIRVNCDRKASAKFVAIGIEHGWSAEPLDEGTLEVVSIRFRRKENAAPPKALLRAFAKAKLVSKIQP